MIHFLFLETFAKIIPIFYAEKLNDTKKERKKERKSEVTQILQLLIRRWKGSRSRPHVSGFFFLTFNLKSTCKRAQNKAHSTLIKNGDIAKEFARRVSESFSPVYMKTLKRWKYDNISCNASSIWRMRSSYSKTSVFFHPHVNVRPAFSKISYLAVVVWNLRFW